MIRIWEEHWVGGLLPWLNLFVLAISCDFTSNGDFGIMKQVLYVSWTLESRARGLGTDIYCMGAYIMRYKGDGFGEKPNLCGCAFGIRGFAVFAYGGTGA